MNHIRTNSLHLFVLMASLFWAQSGFAQSCGAIDALETYVADATPPSGATCATYITQSARSGVSCHWEFSYRDAATKPFADATWTTLTTCRAGTDRAQSNQVNHPDSYALREWDTEQGRYALSVKDKGGLSRTFVFLRFEPAAP